MLRRNIFLMVLVGLLANNLMACTSDGNEGIVPENDMYISANAKSMMRANLDEEMFNQVIDKVIAVYAPIVASKGGNLTVQRDWNDGTVNAYALQQGNNWIVKMFGGLARHEEITPDGFALVVCHEIGHHIGGAPKKRGWWSSAWASNEGQADYFATLKCLRKVFEREDNENIVASLNVPSHLRLSCAAQFNNREEQLICQRGGMAGMSTARLFQALRGETTDPKFDTPSTKRVSRTDDAHPATQCRLDTYFSGALCDIDHREDVSKNDEAKGVCYRNNGHEEGVRPLCWFRPAI